MSSRRAIHSIVKVYSDVPVESFNAGDELEELLEPDRRVGAAVKVPPAVTVGAPGWPPRFTVVGLDAVDVGKATVYART